MKRLNEKFGFRTVKLGEERVTRNAVRSLLPVLILFGFASCQKAWYGEDGHPGDAFVALTWQVSEPSYIDAGTAAIPIRFYYGQYYKIYPGYYNLYYEGKVFTGMYWATYAWEVMYEIWEVPGERGGWYHHGANGPDNFFTIEMSPHGPYITDHYKRTDLSARYKLLEESENQISVIQKGDGVNMKVTYTKVKPRRVEVDNTDMGE
jgi:hypothetical protein